jgi:mycofactocin precursor
MPDSTAIVTENTDSTADDTDVVETELVESDLLVEDVSIDGMCGVY